MNKADRSIVRTGRKFEQVLKGAREVFMKDGFDGASVDDIAKAAGVSKATLYSYFPDKRLLFLEVAKAGCLEQAQQAMELRNLDYPAPVILKLAARKLIDIFMSDFSQKFFRVAIAEAERFPELGQYYFQCGPRMGIERISDFLATATEKGEFVIDDIELAAAQFIELCKADLHIRKLLGVDEDFSEEALDRIANGAVDTFLARYGV